VDQRQAARRLHRHGAFRAQERHPVVVLADNVDKAQNVGGMLRTADAFLVETLLSNRAQPDIGGAMGAQYWQPAQWDVDLIAACIDYRRRDYTAVALEQTPESIPLTRYRFPKKVALVVGSEMFGVSPDMLALVDEMVYIPQAGLIKSFNVGTATAIALYEYARQHWLSEFVQPDRHLEPASLSVRIERPRKQTCRDDG
jgi:tRNA G18 (ribose-2'-O)-methylase SpoU